jgi:signal peptidase I
MTQSMEQVIIPGDVVWTLKKLPWSHFDKTDIVTFHQEGYSTTFVKRIVAISGDTLHFLRNTIRIGNQEIPHDPIFEMMLEEEEGVSISRDYNANTYLKYLLSKSVEEDRIDNYLMLNGTAIIVPENFFFMVGDNYYESMDSRFWGFIPAENIKGKVFRFF